MRPCWTPEEDAVLHRVSAQDAAQILRRSQSAVNNRRSRLGIGRPRPQRQRAAVPHTPRFLPVEENQGRPPQSAAELRFASLMAAVKRYAQEHHERVNVGRLLATLADDWEAWQ